MSVESRIIWSLKTHEAIVRQLEKMGMEHVAASREALRRMQDKKFKFNHWQDYLTAVELEGYSLPHRG